MKKIFLLCVIWTILSGCSEFALLASGSSLAISQNAYVKMYNGADFGITIKTKKGIKQHVYEKGKKYINDNTTSLSGDKH